MLAVTTDR